jgi:hypothetical protein
VSDRDLDGIVNERRRKVIAEAKKKGKTPTAEHLERLAFAIFITNAGVEILDAKVIGTIYRVRWQIELTFKNWKSLLHLDILKGSRQERILSIVYGRLITIVLMTMVYGYITHYLDLCLRREVSTYKVIKWLKRMHRLVNAVCTNSFDDLFDSLLKETPQTISKQKRKRLTTRNLLALEIPYLTSFSSDLISHETIDIVA